jgi:Lipoprotein LpqB beta-propeller domain
MSRAARPWLAGVLLVALLLGGCGIPDDTPVLPIGPGPSAGISAGGDLAPTRHDREATLDKPTFVRNYLEAAAGDSEGALDRAKQFLAPAAAASFKVSSDIRVVHLVEDPLNNPGSDDVTLKFQVVGTLNHNGILDPSSDGTVEQYTMVVGDVSGRSGLFLQKAPPYLMISDKALSDFYDQRSIYFWNTEHTGLVPDVRYMPLTVPVVQQPTEVLNWLIDGPAPWLADAVDPLPDGTSAIGIVPAATNDKLQINLSDQAVPADDPKALDRLRRQLMWSLRPNLPRVLEVKIGHADPNDYSGTDYLTSNFAYQLEDTPERFVVYDGRVRRMAGATGPLPVLSSADNRNVREAALTTAGAVDYAALVVGEAGGESLRVGAAGAGQQATLRRVALPAPIGHPSWAAAPGGGADAIGLIPAKGKLYSFAATGSAPQPVDLPGGLGAVSAVSVAPDAHRVALLARGRLYLTALTTSGGGMQLATPQLIRAPLAEVTAVDWSSEGWLVVAGVKPRADGGRVAIMDMTIDGAAYNDRLGDLGTERVTYLAAYPVNPATGRRVSDAVTYMAGDAAYDALAVAVRITVQDLAEPVPNPPAGVAPTVPFFLN